MEPRRRFGVTHIAKEERVILQREHLLDSRYFWNGNDCFAFSSQSKTPDLRGAAEQIANINRSGRRNDVRDDRFASRHDLNRVLEFWCVEREGQNRSPRRAGPGRE